MPEKLLLQILCLPTLVGALSLAPLTASAITVSTDKASSSSPTATCGAFDERATDRLTTEKSNADAGFLDFSAAASDAAVLLFGCDCSACINALEQLRRPSLFAAAQGHCAQSLSNSQYSDQANEILDAVDAAEAISPDMPLPRDKF
ncbi:MAG: hypothetical protein ACFB5Z_09115 [Elainellaceae cyanobacterium]